MRNDAKVELRVSKGLREALDTAAGEQSQSTSWLVRRILQTWQEARAMSARHRGANE